MVDGDSGAIQRADPIEVRVSEVWPAVDALHHAAGRAEAAGGVVGEFAAATAEAVAATAQLAHAAGRAAQTGSARCSNCPASEKVRSRRRQCWRDAAAWSGVIVALGLGAASLVFRLLGW